MELEFNITLLPDGSVVTRDGEYLGTWENDDNDHLSFTPDGAAGPVLHHPFRYRLCEMIGEWNRELTSSPPMASAPSPSAGE